nr:PREDICTED: uncharacterized protein LOC109034507 [Bemisia tabaci]
MRGLKYRSTLFLCSCVFLAFINYLIDGASSSQIRKSTFCGSLTCPANKKFKFSTNYRYRYKYSVDVATEFAGIGKNASSFQFELELELLWKSSCAGQLQINKVTINKSQKASSAEKDSPESAFGEKSEEESDDLSSQFEESLSQRKLRFHFHEGHVTELCADKDEPVWVLNIKRGILTAFQNTMKRLDLDSSIIETDVNGKCPTKYHLEYVNGTVLIISKKKDIQNCNARYQLHSILPTSPYVFQNKYHKWTPMSATLECRQYIDHGVYLTVSCQETHSFQPLLNQSHNAVTTVSQKLQLLDEEYVSEYDLDEKFETGPIGKRVSLLFDHEKPKKLEVHELHESKSFLKQLCRLDQADEFQHSLPDVYNKFIHSAKHLSYQALAELHQTSNKICPFGKKYVQDALPYFRSVAAVTLMKDVLINQNVSDVVFNEWLFALSIFPRPNDEIVSVAVPLMQHYPENEAVLLSLTSMIHSFCKWNLCENEHNVSIITSHLQNRVNSSILQESYSTGLSVALKAIGNAGVSNPQIIELLNKLIVGKKVPVDIKVAAIGAHRRFLCKVNRDRLMNTYLNRAADVEVRIAAYLQIMKCPSYNVLQNVKASLQAETMNQVGSFVSSHLQNLMKSSMPNKLQFQSMLEDFQFEKKFKSDIRVFSQNYEGSFYLNEYGVGIFVETNVIFSPKSYIPRKISVSVTTNIFDESISLAEFEISLEGFERYAEYFFKPGGPLSFDSLKKGLNLLRIARSISDTLKEKIDGLPNIIEKNFPPPKVLFGFKLFGNEIKYLEFRGESEIYKMLSRFNPYNIVSDFFEGQAIHFERTSMFLDISYVVPTGAGLPLNLNSVGIADIHLEMAGSFQGKNFSETKKLTMSGKLVPRMAVHLEGTMGVDAYCSSTQIKLKSKMYTSSAVNATLQLDSYNLVKLSFHLPLKKSDLFYAESELSILQNNKDVVIEGGQVIGEDRFEDFVCSWDVLDQTMGLKLCVNYMFPNTMKLLKAPLLLFSGPIKFGIVLEKTDPSAKEYFIQYRYLTAENQSIASIEFETPGSSIKRNIKAVVNFDPGNQNITFTYKSATTELQAHGIYKNSPELKLLHFALDINGKKHIDIHLELKTKEERYGYSYQPSASFSINNKNIAELQGTYKWVEKKSISQCDIDLTFKTNKIKTHITGYIVVNEASIAANFILEYQFDAGKAETLKIEIHMADHTTKHLAHLSAELQLASSAYPQIDFIATTKYQKAQGHLELSFDLTANPSLKNESEKLRLQSMLIYLHTPSSHKVSSFIAIKRPSSDIDLKLDGVFEGSEGHWNIGFHIQYAKDKVIGIKLDLVLPKSTTLYIEIHSSLSLPQVQHPMSLFLRVHEKSRSEYDLEVIGTWFSGHNITTKGVYLNKSNQITTYLVLKLVLKSGMFNDIMFNGKFLFDENEIRLDLLAEHNEIKYALLLKHLSLHPALRETHGEVTFNESTYSLTSMIDFMKKQALLELHLDKHRDIHVGVHGIHEKQKTDTGFFVKWDANRDPNQKLALTLLTASTDSASTFEYSVKLLFEYPSHLITGSALLERQGTNYMSTLAVEWSPKQSIDIVFLLNYDFPDSGKIFFETKVLTPFENWRETSLTYKLHYLDSNITTGAKISWNDDQNIIANIGLNYQFLSNDTKLAISCVLESTIEDIKAVKAILNHEHGNKQFKTDITLQSSPSHLLSMLSAGKIIINDNSSSVIFSLTTATPFLPIKTGGLECLLSLGKDKNIRGDIRLMMDDNTYQAILLGIVKNPKESKILLKMTTPFEKYNLIKGRFGFSEKNKHFFAELIGPSSTAGLELKYFFIDSSSFNLKLHLTTPFAVLYDLTLVGFINEENVDFRCGWNSMMLGIIGSDHFESWYDINYSLTLFTPIEGFKKSSAVFKIDYSDHLDLETRVLLPTMRVGLKALCIYQKMNSTSSELDEESFFADDLIPKKDLFWRGAVNIDTLFYPTLKVELNVTEHDLSYTTNSLIDFPNFGANITNKLFFSHLMGMNNSLVVETTAPAFSKAICNYKMEGTFGRSMKSNLALNVTSHNQSLPGSVDVEYTFRATQYDDDLREFSDRDKYGLYVTQVNIRTPFSSMQYVKGVMFFQVDRNSFENNVSIVTNFSKMFLEASLQSYENYFESAVGINISSKFIKFPYFKMLIKKDFLELDKKIRVNFILPSTTSAKLDNYDVETLWRFENNYLKLYGKLMTPFKSIDILQGGMEYIHENTSHTYFINSHFQRAAEVEMKLSAKLHNRTLLINLESLVEGLKNVQFVGALNKSGKQQNIEATMISDQTYKIVGWATTSEHAPLSFKIKLMKNDRSEEVGSIIMYIKRRDDGFEIETMLQYEDRMVEFESKLKYHSPEAKMVNILISSTHPDYKRLQVDGLLLAKHFGQFIMTVKGGVESKWLDTTYNAHLKVWTEQEKGILLSSIDSSQLSSNTQFVWIWKSEAFHTSFNSFFRYNGLTQQFLSKVFFWNPNEDFKSICMGSQINNNDNWVFTANATVLAPSSTNCSFTSYFQLPDNREMLHVMVGKLLLLDQYNFINHALQYSVFPNQVKFRTFSELQISPDEMNGLILLQNKEEVPPFFLNSFKAKIVKGVYNVTNVLSTVLLRRSLVSFLEYKKPSSRHIINLRLYNPVPNLIAKAFVDFESFNNLAASVNSTTPFPSIPHLGIDLKAITTDINFERYLKILWKNNSALFNMTHHMKVGPSSNLTNGVVMIEFPVASQHIGKLVYGYEDSGKKLSGFSTVIFNNEKIIDSKVSRETYFGPHFREDIVNLSLDNYFVPIGIGYLGQHSQPNLKVKDTFVNFKRMEFYKLHNRTAFNLTGEVLVNQNATGRLDSFKLMNAKRSLVMQSYLGKDYHYEHRTFLTLRNELWAGYEVKLSNKETTWFGKEVEFKLTYPLRNITLIGDLILGDSFLNSQLTVNSDTIYSAKTVGTGLTWKRMSTSADHHQAVVMITHPSLKKNITLTGNYVQYNYSQADLKLVLEYSLDRNKKVEILGNLLDNSSSSGYDYSLTFNGKHPATRFKFDLLGLMSLNNEKYDVAENISYKRSYLPTQYWDSRALVNWKKNEVEFQRHSLRSVAHMKGAYGKISGAHLVNISMIKDKNVKVVGFLYLNPEKKYTNMMVNLTPDESERLLMEGTMGDNRNVMLDVWRVYDDLVISDLKFYVALNHSRLLSSAIIWRPENQNEILASCYGLVSYVWDYVHETSEFWTSYIKSEIADSVADIWFDAKPIVQDFIDDIGNLKVLQDDINYFKKQLNDSYNANEFFMKDIHTFYLVLAEEMLFKDQLNSLPKIFNELWEIMGETGQTIRKSILWIVETSKRIYEKFAEVIRNFLKGDTLNQISDFASKVMIKYDKMIKDMHVSFLMYIERLWSETGSVMVDYWHRFLRNVEPMFIQVVHHLETVVWNTCKQIIEFIYEKRLELLNSTIFAKNSNLSMELDAFYKDLTKNDIVFNFKKYTGILLRLLKDRYFSLVPFGNELNAIALEIGTELKELYKLPVITFAVENVQMVYSQIMWVYDYFQISQKLQQAVPLLYRKMNDYLHTSLQNELMNHKTKTKFIFDPENGVIELTQKLPMPWHAFNETPNFEYVAEYRAFVNVQKFFTPSNISFWSLYNKCSPYLDPSNWLPPFKSYAIIAGPRHFLTLDHKLYEFRGMCSYLLAKDFLNNEFALVLQYDRTAPKNYYMLTLITEGRTITIDLYRDAVDISDMNLKQMPTQINGLAIYQENSRVIVDSSRGFSLECNLKFDICLLQLSGWFHGKTAGLLGTMDNEQFTDFMTSEETVAKDVNLFTQSWSINSGSDICLPMFSSARKKYQPVELVALCDSLFRSKASGFASCFSVVDPHPYNEMCRQISSGEETEYCTSAVTYAKACAMENSPLQLPHDCVRCILPNNSTLTEGDLINLKADEIPKSADVILIIEAKECNKLITERKSIGSLLNTLEKELQECGIRNNRFSVVVFGGNGVYSKPRNIIINDDVFTESPSAVLPHVASIPTGNGSSDIYEALLFASKMFFRPGASKVFILLPCSSCNPSDMRLDHSVIHQALSDLGITLHVLMDQDFNLEKSKVNKIFYGLDAFTAYTKNDFKQLKGEVDLKRQVKLSKSVLGYCIPLALETNGTLFTAKKLESDNMNVVKKFVGVFAKRVAQSAMPSSCQSCECFADNHGISKMSCSPCSSFKIAPQTDFDDQGSTAVAA